MTLSTELLAYRLQVLRPLSAEREQGEEPHLTRDPQQGSNGSEVKRCIEMVRVQKEKVRRQCEVEPICFERERWKISKIITLCQFPVVHEKLTI